MFARELVENGLEFSVAVGGFGEMERRGGGSVLFIEQRDMMSVARGVDPDADVQACRSLVGHDKLLNGVRVAEWLS